MYNQILVLAEDKHVHDPGGHVRPYPSLQKCTAKLKRDFKRQGFHIYIQACLVRVIADPG